MSGTIAVEIVVTSHELDRFLRMIAMGASPPLTIEELVKRWLAFGLHYEISGAKPLDECAKILSDLRVTKK